MSDYTDYLMGVRQWRVDSHGYLRSATQVNAWAPSVVETAECKRYCLNAYAEVHPVIGGEAPPHEGHMCGLYAFYDRDTALSHGNRLTTSMARGVVSAWGEVITHEHGFRAQHMRVEAIILEQEYMTVMGSRVSLKQAHEELAGRYGVPLLKPSEVSAFMSLSGVVLEPDPAPLTSVYSDTPGMITASGHITSLPAGAISSSGYLSPGKASLPAPRPVGWGAHGGPHYGADIVYATWEPPSRKPPKPERFWQKVKRYWEVCKWPM